MYEDKYLQEITLTKRGQNGPKMPLLAEEPEEEDEAEVMLGGVSDESSNPWIKTEDV